MNESARDVWDESRRATLIHQILNGEQSLDAACAAHGISPETVRSWAPVYRQRTQQALDEKLQQASLITGVSAERSGSAVYTGSLDDIAVPDLLQTCQMGNKDAVITVTHGSERSSIWCERGVIVDAESGALRGEPAIYRILNLEQGQVTADFRLEARTRTVELPCHVLLIEGARHRDECARLMPQLKGPRSIFVQAPGAWAAHTTLMDREVLALCDGERSVSNVLAASNLSDLDTLATMVRLVGRGYLLIDGSSASPPSVAESPVTGDWGSCSNIYLPLPQTAPPVGRSKRSAALLVALGLVLGSLLWLGVDALRGHASFRMTGRPGAPPPVEVSSRRTTATVQYLSAEGSH
jgi:hypothetical protein